jgi:hypothetical protein
MGMMRVVACSNAFRTAKRTKYSSWSVKRDMSVMTLEWKKMKDEG